MVLTGMPRVASFAIALPLALLSLSAAAAQSAGKTSSACQAANDRETGPMPI